MVQVGVEVMVTVAVVVMPEVRRTVIMRFELLAIIMSVTWSRVLPATSMPLTSKTSSLTDNNPVDSANPPGTRREMKMPGNLVNPVSVTRTLTPAMRGREMEGGEKGEWNGRMGEGEMGGGKKGE